MSNRNSGLLFALGAAVGAAAGYFLNSDRGRKIRKESTEKISDWSDKAAENAQEVVDQSKHSAQQLLRKSEELANRLQAVKNEFMEYNSKN